jgi:hypothetical protein
MEDSRDSRSEAIRSRVLFWKAMAGAKKLKTLLDTRLQLRLLPPLVASASLIAACSGSIVPPLDAGPDISTASADSGPAGGSDTGALDAPSRDAPAIHDAAAGDAALADGAGSACSLPMDVGPCDAAVPRWYFEPKSGRCTTFSYGGCAGNANNFKTAADCAAACQPGEPAPCTRIDCFPGQRCVYAGASATPVCAAPCNDAGGCAIITQTCGCGASCPFCKNCVRVCL